MTPDDYGLFPAGYEAGNSRNDNRFAEDGAAEGVADGTIGREPHYIPVSCGSFQEEEDADFA